MEILKLQVPPLGTNCYLVSEGKDSVIIDPGGAPERILEVIKERRISPAAILLTHGHFDHAGGAAYLKKALSVPLLIHMLDKDMPANAALCRAAEFGCPYTPAEPDRLFSDGEVLTFGSLSFTVLHTPGHTPGSSCFLSENILFSGDTLFRGTIGMFDRSEKEKMRASVRRLLSLPDRVRVYPGHEAATDIGTEKVSNPFRHQAFSGSEEF